MDIVNLFRPGFSSFNLPETETEPENSQNILSLHLNENSLGSPLPNWYNRYADPNRVHLKEQIAKIKGVAPENIFTTNGSVSCYDILLKLFCTPGLDNIIVCNPGLEKVHVAADLLTIETRTAILQDDFQADLIQLENLADEKTKIIFLSSPNHISGVSLERDDVEFILNNFGGVVVIDESYINFSRRPSFIRSLQEYDRLVLVQSFNKAWGLAGLNVGLLLAAPQVIEATEKMGIASINSYTANLLVEAIKNIDQVNAMIKDIVSMRNALVDILKKIPQIERIYSSEANFILIRLNGARKLYEHLLTQGIRVFDAGYLPLCENCLRITVGNEFENTRLIDAIFDFFHPSE